MSLVEVVIQGRCVDRQNQEALVADICQLEKLGNSQVATVKQEPRIGYPGVEIHPTVLLSAAVFEGEPAPSHLEKIDGSVYLVEEVVLYGHELSLAEPISRKANLNEALNGKFGFVFLRSRDPILDGRLVSPCGINPQHPFAQQAKWMLEPPSISFADSLGGWGAEFLGWVRLTHIPNLNIWISNEGHSREIADTSSWRNWTDKESQLAALKEAYLALSGVNGNRAEETWEMESLFKDEG